MIFCAPHRDKASMQSDGVGPLRKYRSWVLYYSERLQNHHQTAYPLFRKYHTSVRTQRHQCQRLDAKQFFGMHQSLPKSVHTLQLLQQTKRFQVHPISHQASVHPRNVGISVLRCCSLPAPGTLPDQNGPNTPVMDRYCNGQDRVLGSFWAS